MKLEPNFWINPSIPAARFERDVQAASDRARLSRVEHSTSRPGGRRNWLKRARQILFVCFAVSFAASAQQASPRLIPFQGRLTDQQGRAYGLEVYVRRPIADGFYGGISYTLARSERVNPGGDWFVSNFDQTHSLGVVASYEFSGWRLGASFQLVTGRPTLSVCSATYDADANDYDGTFCDLGARLPIFHQLNIRIDRDFNIANTIRGSVFLDILNVYNATNAEGLVYQYDYVRSAQIPGLPILGTLGIRGYYE